jgi:hypothetical protein
MHKIIVGLSRHRDFAIFGRGIQWFQGTPYSHAYIRFDSTEFNRTIIYQASGLRVNLISKAKFDSINFIVKEFEVEISDEKFSEILGFCADELGKPYSLKAIIGIVFHTLFGWKVINSDKLESFICSELVGYILQMIGIIEQNKDLDYFTPKDVDSVMTNYLSSN